MSLINAPKRTQAEREDMVLLAYLWARKNASKTLMQIERYCSRELKCTHEETCAAIRRYWND